MRLSTRLHVLSLDFRQFAKAAYHFRAESPITASLAAIPNLFPSLECILFDGHTEIEAPRIFRGGFYPARGQGPVLLSLAGCETLVESKTLESTWAFPIKYLDISGLPGSLRPLIHSADRFPHLCVLKARRRELGPTDANDLVRAFSGTLWSLDLSDNPVPDVVLRVLGLSLMKGKSLRNDNYFAAEGALDTSRREGSNVYGPFYHIKESGFSDTFSHPDRYLADPPTYFPGMYLDESHRPEAVRANGRMPIRNDSMEFLKQAILGDASPIAANAALSAERARPTPLSHLHISNTKVSALGIERLVRESPGQLELLDCDSAQLNIEITRQSKWPKSTKLYGMLGSSHVFRPVFSSNLSELRVHHSLVTQIPTLEAEGLSSLHRLWLAETVIRQRCEMAYPQAFVPDMNPRITSLTLTRIPRRSSGPLIDKIVGFLRAAAVQERTIAEATTSSSRRAPMMLRGLRRICLEFEADPMDDPGRFATSADLDADGVLDLSLDAVSLNHGETTEDAGPRKTGGAASPLRTSQDGSTVASFSRYGKEYVQYTALWGPKSSEAKVWVGSGIKSSSPAVNAYQELVRRKEPSNQHRYDYRRVIGCASPAHVAAGVPAGSLIFLDAWEAMILPETVAAAPREEALARMKDVLTELKRYRVATRNAYAAEKAKAEKARKEEEARGGEMGSQGAVVVPLGSPHYFYTGAVEVIAKDSRTHYHASEYWR